MKTQELFELRKSKTVTKKRYSEPDPTSPSGYRHVPDGIPYQDVSFYKPGFRKTKRDPNIGDILGTIGDWLDEMGATKEDIAPAREAAVNSPEYQRLIKMGFKDVTTPGEVKAGTIGFQAVAPMRDWNKQVIDQKILRKVHINGNIRTHAFRPADREVGTHHAGRGRTYHPMTVKSHPNMTGVERLSGSMRASMKRLADMYRKPFLKGALDKMQSQATGT